MKSRGIALCAILVAASLAACGKDKPAPSTPRVVLTPEQRAKVEALFATAKAHAETLDTERRAAVDKAPSTAVPRADLGRCPFDATTLVPEDPTKGETNAAKRMLTAQRTTRVLTITDLTRPGKPPNGTPAASAMQKLLDDADKNVGLGKTFYPPDTPDAQIAKLETALAAFDDGYDLSLVATIFDEPQTTGEGTFEKGHLRGTLYLWSRKQHAITCVADVRDSGSDVVTVTEYKGMAGGGAASALWGDLLESAVLGHLPRLVAAGPPLPGPDAGKRRNR
jgi:hypothetical protein